MENLNLKETLEKVKSWAKEVGAMQAEKIEEEVKFSTKSSKVDMVTEVDLASEKFILGKIRENYPNHSILSEEEGEIKSDSKYTWVVDPLDGTTNYLHGFPIFCVSIALKHLEDTLLGVVYVPMIKEMFYSIKGEGSYLNGRALKVSNANDLGSCVLATGFPYDRNLVKEDNLDIFQTIIKEIQGIRRTGSAAFDLCSVAKGRIDGYWELKLSPWDIAAGKLIVEEAGGKVVTSEMKKANGTMGINVIAGNEKIVTNLKSKITKLGKYY